MENDEVIDEVNEELTNASEVDEVENQEAEIKTYSEEEVEAIKAQMKEDNQKAWNKRWGREKSKIERENAEKDELINLLKQQTGKDNLNELIDLSYSQYGIERPNKTNSKDDERLGKLDAQDILELDDETIEDEANRLASISNRSVREEATFMELGSYLTSKKEQEKIKKEIKESGIDENVLENEEFKSFMNKFNKDTSITDIYNIFTQTHSVAKKKPFSAGSIKGKSVKEDSEFYTLDEYQALTEKDLDNPKVYEKAMRSMRHFYNSK